MVSEQSEHLARHAAAMADLSARRRDDMGRRGREYYEQHFERQLLLQRWNTLLHEVMEDHARCAA